MAAAVLNGKLPSEITLHVLSLLDTKGLRTLSMCSKAFRREAEPILFRMIRMPTTLRNPRAVLLFDPVAFMKRISPFVRHASLITSEYLSTTDTITYWRISTSLLSHLPHLLSLLVHFTPPNTTIPTVDGIDSAISLLVKGFFTYIAKTCSFSDNLRHLSFKLSPTTSHDDQHSRENGGITTNQPKANLQFLQSMLNLAISAPPDFAIFPSLTEANINDYRYHTIHTVDPLDRVSLVWIVASSASSIKRLTIWQLVHGDMRTRDPFESYVLPKVKQLRINLNLMVCEDGKYIETLKTALPNLEELEFYVPIALWALVNNDGKTTRLFNQVAGITSLKRARMPWFGSSAEKHEHEFMELEDFKVEVEGLIMRAELENMEQMVFVTNQLNSFDQTTFNAIACEIEGDGAYRRKVFWGEVFSAERYDMDMGK
ncbi:hypothetical protein TWF694_003374 [Orbilia ellipsospora]|uniref:F-box domain-containing protein n=1 Tax=Orbilia ellipsospora TaxID=2528407 RepID=A0AAV9WZ88_9PEZI